MLKEEKTRIFLKIDEMERYVEELKEFLPKEEEYLANIVKRRASEKTIELAIESMVDACAMIISFQKLGLPSDEDNIFDILIKKKALSALLGKKLKHMKGFRNIIVHKYGDVDNNMAFVYLSSNLDDFYEFKDAVIKYLDNPKK